MRIFLVFALVFFVIGFICVAAPASVFGLGALGWGFLGFISYTLNYLTNEWRIGPPIG
jgi:hypothetical protein